MRFFPILLFFVAYPACADAAAPACVPLQVMHHMQSEPDGWLLLAGLVVCIAGRLAQRRG